MFLSTLALALALAPSSLAQSTQTIQVGPTGTLAYSPPSITASAGDTIRFVFNPKNHTVTQSSFSSPCVPLAGGASSGFKPVSNVSALLTTWDFVVADTTGPSWFFCEQTGHCGQGMVFAINAPADPDPHSFDAFQALAKQLNGTGSASASVPPPTASAQSASFTAPPPQSWATATATVSEGASTWTTVYTSYDGTPAPTFAPSGPVDHKILVGADGLTFTPSNISAAINDTVTFEFHPNNHTVTQSSFESPCEALAKTSTTGQVGFKSGFQFVPQNQTDNFPTFQITINDTAPIWGYCGQTVPVVHCTAGMVFSINAVESGPNNFAAFQEIARQSGNSTGTSSASAAGASQSGKNGAVEVRTTLLGLILGVIGVASGLL